MSKIIVLVSFVAAFAAGWVVGTKWRAPVLPEPPPAHPGGPMGWLERELNLTPQQREQMKQIWSAAAERGRGEWAAREERRRQLFQERDKAIADLLGPESEAKYREIQKRFWDQMGELDREKSESFEQAVNETKGILDARQREKYEQILKSRPRGPGGPDRDRGPRGPRDRRGRGREHGRPGSDRATSQPVSAPQD